MSDSKKPVYWLCHEDLIIKNTDIVAFKKGSTYKQVKPIENNTLCLYDEQGNEHYLSEEKHQNFTKEVSG